MKKHLVYTIFFLTSFIVYAETELLLDDRKEMEEYISRFPFRLYQIYNVPGQGNFFLDNINDSVKNVLKRGIIWEPHILNLARTYIRPGSVAIDIGAHIGTLAIPMAVFVGSNGKIYTFEPQKKIYRELVMNIFLNRMQNVVKPFRFAIGDKHTIIEMNPTVKGAEAGTGIGKGGDKVEMRTLDSFDFQNVSFIKIDVEGSENQVIDGMVNTIIRNKPVIILEICGGNSWNNAPPEIRKIIIGTQNKLRNLGYEVSLIRDHDYLALPIN